MKITGAEVIYLLIDFFILWLAIKSSIEAWYVFRNRVTDKKGKSLWFYVKIDGLPVAAKNKTQALALTIGVAVIGFALALPQVIVFFHHLMRN